MAQIIKTYRQSLPALRFIGKRYGDADRVNGGFGQQWGQWFAEGWFEVIEKQLSGSLRYMYEDDGAYIGLMRWKEGEPFEYWIGLFAPEGSPAPEGFECIDMPRAELGVCWLYGPENDLYCHEDLCAAKLKEEGYEVTPDGSGVFWFFERYGCPRFTTPDEKGNIILDICHYVK